MIQARQKKLASFSISTKPPSMHPRNERSVFLQQECLSNAGLIKTIEHRLELTFCPTEKVDGFPKGVVAVRVPGTCPVSAPGYATPRTRLLGLWDSFSLSQAPPPSDGAKVNRQSIDNNEWRTREFPVLGTIFDN